MGQKVNPRAFRLGMSEQWNSRWFSGAKTFSRFLQQDVRMRKFIQTKFKEGGVDRILIERSRGEVGITITTAKPGVLIGRGGTGIEDLKKELQKQFMDSKTKLKITIQEVENANLSAGSVLHACITDIERRLPFRRVMKQNIDKVMKAGALGVKIAMSGRLNGVDIARREKLTQGKIPLHTLRAHIDYSRGTAHTTYGTIGIKVWIYRGLYFEESAQEKEAQARAAQKAA